MGTIAIGATFSSRGYSTRSRKLLQRFEESMNGTNYWLSIFYPQKLLTDYKNLFIPRKNFYGQKKGKEITSKTKKLYDGLKNQKASYMKITYMHKTLPYRHYL